MPLPLERGGLVMYRYHQGMPVSGTTCMDDCYNQGPTVPRALLPRLLDQSGNSRNSENTASCQARLHDGSIKAMAAVNMPAILAISTRRNPTMVLVEQGTGAEFIALWKYTFNYLTTTKGKQQPIWLMPYSGAPTAAYWPGPTMVDVSEGYLCKQSTVHLAL